MADLVEADIYPAGLEPHLAIHKVIVPESAKSLVEAQCLDRWPSLVEPRSPIYKRTRVARAEMLCSRDLKPGMSRLGFNNGFRWQHTAREYAELDEVGPATVFFVAAFVNCYRL